MFKENGPLIFVHSSVHFTKFLSGCPIKVGGALLVEACFHPSRLAAKQCALLYFQQSFA